MNRNFLKTMVFAVVLLACFLMANADGASAPVEKAVVEAKNEKLNIVFFIVDDLGWKDLSCMGSDFYETPAIDKLAGDGVLFSDAYQASPRCVTSRLSIMTGKYHYRPEIKEGHGLALKEVTIAEAFKASGYRTFFAGKWHLGEKGHWPEDQGFDVNKGGCEYGSPPSYFYPYSKGDKGTPPGLEGGHDGEYMTDRLTDEAIEFLNDHTQSYKDKPFLLYLSHYGVHTPFEGKKELVEKYEKKLASMPKDDGPDFIIDHTGSVKMKQDHAIYAAMIESVDESMKRLRAELERLGLADNTAIILTSDNGGLSTRASTSKRQMATSNYPLRTGKGWIYEGGIRLPLMVLWPGVTKAGSVSSSPVVGTDLYPTMLEMAGLDMIPEQHVDGVSFKPILEGDTSFKRKPIYWYYTFAKEGTGNPSMAAMREGDYKLVEFMYEDRVELYNIKDDAGEQKDMSEELSKRTDRMLAKLHGWVKQTNAWPMSKNFIKMNQYLLEEAQKVKPKQKNVIFVLSDDHRYDFMSFLGKPKFLKTPNMDRMASQGAYIKNATVSTSLCSPSRASILTGQYAHRHGVVDNHSAVPDGTEYFPQYLQEAGYETAFMGKWHMGDSSDKPRAGFDKWISFRGQGVYNDPVLNIDGQRVERQGHISDILTEYALDWLENGRDKNKPYFLYLSHKAVHAMFKPAKRHLGQYEDVKLIYPDTMADTEENYDGKPAWVKAQRDSWHGVDYMYHGKMDFDTFYKRYCETLLGVDESLGKMLDYVDRSDDADSTVVMYMGDNGFCFGEHGLIDKRHMYEGSMRVPMLAYGPGMIQGGIVIEELIQNIDVGPTILDLAGEKVPSHMDGRSFKGLLEGKKIAWRDEVYYEYYWERSFPHTPTVHGVRTDRYKYIHYHGVWDIDELYDLQTDPDEKRNLINEPEYKELVKELNKKMYDWLDNTDGMVIPLRRDSSFRAAERSADKK